MRLDENHIKINSEYINLFLIRKFYLCALYTLLVKICYSLIDLNPCAQELASFTSTHNGLPLLGAHKPVCDSDGYYQPKQCAGSQYV